MAGSRRLSDLQHFAKLCPSGRRVKTFIRFCVDMDFDTQNRPFSFGVAKFLDQTNHIDTINFCDE